MYIAMIHTTCDTSCIQSRTNICLGKNSGTKPILNVETLVVDDIMVNNNVDMICCTKKKLFIPSYCTVDNA